MEKFICSKNIIFYLQWHDFKQVEHILGYINYIKNITHVNGLVQNCSNSIANALELLQSCTKPSICLSCQYFSILILHMWLTHWGRVTHISVDNLAFIGSDNGLSPGRRQAIIWTNAGILLIGPWGTNFSELLIGIHTFSFKKIPLKMLSVKWRPFCLGLNVLIFFLIESKDHFILYSQYHGGWLYGDARSPAIKSLGIDIVILKYIKNNAWVIVSNDFWVTSEAICQWFSRVTKSRVKIIGKSPHEWPKNHYSW